jgi:pectin methylesterase-like acyl-CoA thioesterase
MKQIAWLLSAVLLFTLLAGCAKKGVNPAPLESSFRTADPAVKSDVDKAVIDIKAGNYSEALAYLNKIAGKARLTAEQQQAVKDVISQITAQMQQAAAKAAAGAQKSATDLQKSLPK